MNAVRRLLYVLFPFLKPQRHHNWQRKQESVEELIDPAQRAREAAEHVEEATAEDDRLSEAETKRTVRIEMLKHHPYNQPTSEWRINALRTAGTFVTLADTGGQYLVNRATWPSAPTSALVFGSLLTAVGMGILSQTVIVAVAHDDARPAKAIRRTSSIAITTFVLAMIFALVVLLGRTLAAEQAERLASAMGLSLWLWAEIMPICGGAFLAWAHVLELPKLEYDALRDIRDERVAIRRFLEVMKQYLPVTTVSPASEAQIDIPREDAGAGHGIGVMKAEARRFIGFTMLIVTLAASAAAIPSPAYAQKNAALVSSAAVPSAQQPRTCGFAADRTLSTESAQRARAIATFIGSLKAAVTMLNCSDVAVGTFADEGAWAPHEWLKVPAQPLAIDCDAVEAGADGPRKFIDGVFPGPKNGARLKAIAACRDSAKRDSIHFINQWRTFQQRIAYVLGAAQEQAETGSRIVDALRSYYLEGVETLVAITDAIETDKRPVPRLAYGNTSLILLLVPAADIYGGPDATAAAAREWVDNGGNVITAPFTAVAAPTFWSRTSRQIMQACRTPCQTASGQSGQAAYRTVTTSPRRQK